MVFYSRWVQIVFAQEGNSAAWGRVMCVGKVMARGRKELVARWGDVSELSGGSSIRVMPCFRECEDIRVVRVNDIRNEGFAVLMEKRANVEGVDSSWDLGRARVRLDITGKENENECE